MPPLLCWLHNVVAPNAESNSPRLTVELRLLPALSRPMQNTVTGISSGFHPVSLKADSLEVMGEVYRSRVYSSRSEEQLLSRRPLQQLFSPRRTSTACSQLRYTDETVYPGLSVCLLTLSHFSGAACAETRTFILSRFKRSRWLLYSPDCNSIFYFLQTEYLSHRLSSLHIGSSLSKTNLKY